MTSGCSVKEYRIYIRNDQGKVEKRHSVIAKSYEEAVRKGEVYAKTFGVNFSHTEIDTETKT
tara:strand:- start:705 stop:890 length:186 start_codon:yes stop_codon:yes gene_type:complete